METLKTFFTATAVAGGMFLIVWCFNLVMSPCGSYQSDVCSK